MSNHWSASHNQTILINWNNGVRTFVLAPTYDAHKLVERIKNELPKWIEWRDSDFNLSLSSCGIVWHLESFLQYNYESGMILLYPEDIISHPTVVLDIGEPYDVGEIETVEEIQKVYPEYKYPYTSSIKNK